MSRLFLNYCCFSTFLTMMFYQSHLGRGIKFPAEWSLIQHLFDSTDGLYPKDHVEEEWRRRGSRVTSWSFFGGTLSETSPGNFRLVEPPDEKPVGSSSSKSEARNALYRIHGDILYAENSPTPSGAAIKSEVYRWPGFPGDGTVPYVIDDTLESITDKIEMAMEQYHKLTCIRFVQWTDEDDYIYLYKGTGCTSYVGRQGGKQLVTLGRGCEFVGTIVHELGHAIGLYHEHQRTDRDDYIYVYIDNVEPGKESNFEITAASEELKLTKFDYLSIMIYGEYAFSDDPNNLKTMEAKNESVQLLNPFDKPGMDNTDILQVNRLYECEME